MFIPQSCPMCGVYIDNLTHFNRHLAKHNNESQIAQDKVGTVSTKTQRVDGNGTRESKRPEI